MLCKYREPWACGHKVLAECIVVQLVIGDTAQLLSGRLLGRHRIFPVLSPKKTFEGYVGGFCLMAAYGHFIHGWGFARLVLAYTAGCIGDLFFSFTKRRLGIKDFSVAMGSHGGILDRIDSYMFAADALFYLSCFGIQL